jgi:hypothetical protein
MAEPLKPAANKTYGRENWIFVPTIASAALAPTVAEVTGASSLDITRIAFRDGAPNITQNTNLVEQQQRLGDTDTFEFIGTTKYSGGVMDYQFDPQGAAASDGVKLWEKIQNAPGTVTGFLVRRLGVGRAVTPIAGQFIDAIPVEFGPSLPGKKGDGESAETSAQCSFAVTAKPAFKVAILA